MNTRSIPLKYLILAQKNGEEIWQLDTGRDGEDDMLIGTEDEVRYDITYLHELENGWPEHWTLTKVDWPLDWLIVEA